MRIPIVLFTRVSSTFTSGGPVGEDFGVHFGVAGVAVAGANW